MLIDHGSCPFLLSKARLCPIILLRFIQPMLTSQNLYLYDFRVGGLACGCLLGCLDYSDGV